MIVHPLIGSPVWLRDTRWWKSISIGVALMAS
jgi:hypothetical protein